MTTHGGKRPNAGRPMKGDQKKETRTFSFDAENLKALEGEKNKSKIVNAGLDIVIPAIQGNEDQARRNLENFINERK